MKKKKVKKENDILEEIKLKRPVRIDQYKDDIMKRMNGALAETPGWVLKMNPNAPKELPEWIVKDFNNVLEDAKKWKKKQKEYFDSIPEDERGEIPETLAAEKHAMRGYMNNFYMRIIKDIPTRKESRLKKKIGIDRGEGTSDLMRNQTYGEYYEVVKKTAEKCGVSLEEAGKLDIWEGTKYLLPVFLRLLEMGYKSYPDLSG